MKVNLISISIFLLSLGITGITGLNNSNTAYSQDKLTLAIDEWEPFISQKLPNNGPLSEIVRRAFEEVDINVNYIFVPWQRAYNKSAIGTYDGSPGWGINDERNALFYFSAPLLTQKEYLFFSKANPLHADTVDDLAGLTYGMIRGAMITEELVPLYKKGEIDIVQHHNYETLFKMLMRGRIDYIPIGNFVGMKYLRQVLPPDQWDQIGYLEHLTKPIIYYLIIPKVKENGLELIKAFNKGLQAIRESGEYDQLLEAVYNE